MTLNLLKTGDSATIESIDADVAFKARICAMGLRIGKQVKIIRRANMGGPLQVRVGYTDVLMSREQANLIKLLPQIQ